MEIWSRHVCMVCEGRPHIRLEVLNQLEVVGEYSPCRYCHGTGYVEEWTPVRDLRTVLWGLGTLTTKKPRTFWKKKRTIREKMARLIWRLWHKKEVT